MEKKDKATQAKRTAAIAESMNMSTGRGTSTRSSSAYNSSANENTDGEVQIDESRKNRLDQADGGTSSAGKRSVKK
jgi:hypothetical protein